jgi:hypothetical protein
MLVFQQVCWKQTQHKLAKRMWIRYQKGTPRDWLRQAARQQQGFEEAAHV